MILNSKTYIMFFILLSVKICVGLQSTNLTSSMAISALGTLDKEPKPLLGKAWNLSCKTKICIKITFVSVLFVNIQLQESN